jgi:predicted secreted hydrolase
MRVLKLFAPLIVLALLAVAVVGFLRFRHGHGQAPPSADLNAFVRFEQASDQKPINPAEADPPARAAFDLGQSHIEVDQEWWYFNTHMIDERNQRYTFMFALLKNGELFGSLGVLDKQVHHALFTHSTVDIDHKNRLITAKWSSLSQPDPNRLVYEFTFDHPLCSMILKLTANKLPLAVGGEGYVAMGEAGKSYYFSLTNMQVQGTGSVAGVPIRVRGRGWMDRQWGNWRDRDFDQWHWYSIQLTNNVEIVIFDFRKNGKSLTPLCDVVFADGSTRHGLKFNLKVLGHWTSPKTQKNWSSGWQLEIPELEANLMVIPDMQDQEVTDALWEGGCRVSGIFGSAPIWGRAFYEARHRTW